VSTANIKRKSRTGRSAAVLSSALSQGKHGTVNLRSFNSQANHFDSLAVTLPRVT
ncbi:hypothetical protein L9F63_007892, partial [Diploptera punctata]